jgi:streptogrisin C
MPFRTNARYSIFLSAMVVLAGLPVTPAQAAPSNADRHASGLFLRGAEDLYQPIPESLRDAYGVYDLMAEANPDDFGYVRVSGNSLVVTVVTDRGVDRISALTAGRPLPALAVDPYGKVGKTIAESRGRIAGVQMTSSRSQLSRANAERLKHEVTDIAYVDPGLTAAGIWRTGVDRSTGRVAIWLENLTDDAAATLVSRYGTEQVEIIEAPNPRKNNQLGRLADGSPFKGGARITAAGNGCSDAFSWNITGISGMLTAGHCIPDGGYVTTPVQGIGNVTANSRENYSSTGTVFLPGESVYRGDMALIEVLGSRTSDPYIYRGVNNGTSSSVVGSMWSRRAQPGDQYCTGGSYGGEICGWQVYSINQNEYVSGKWLRNVAASRPRTGWCTRLGDSGGSVFTVTSTGIIVAKGIHNAGGGGGGDDFGGTGDPCTESFTDIYDAYYGFPGFLKVR